MIPRLAQADDLPALAGIWNASFPGDEAFSQWFLENVFAAQNALVWEADGRAAGMLHLLPMQCRTGDQWLPAAYIFAVAVLPHYRGRGAAAQLLEEALRLSRARGAALAMLVPQSPSLFDYYRRQGFETGLFRSRRVLTRPHGIAPGLALDDQPDMEELNAFYSASLAARPCVTRTPEHWARVLTYLRPLAVREEGRLRGYAVYDPEGGTVRELVAQDEDARAALASGALHRLGLSEATAYGPDGTEEPYGMIRPLIPGTVLGDCYANLMLD